MSTTAKLRGEDFDRMVRRGAFVDIGPLKVELINGDLRLMNPAGPVHDGEVEFLTNWSYANTARQEVSIRVQSGIECGDDRPEPDIIWSRKMQSKRVRPTHADILLLIEVSDSSLELDMIEKSKLYANYGIPEFWVIDIPSEKVHVHRSPQDGRYQSILSFEKGDTISPVSHQNAKLLLSELFDIES
jgi:Uma2 family endonuclease